MKLEKRLNKLLLEIGKISNYKINNIVISTSQISKIGYLDEKQLNSDLKCLENSDYIKFTLETVTVTLDENNMKIEPCKDKRFNIHLLTNGLFKVENLQTNWFTKNFRKEPVAFLAFFATILIGFANLGLNIYKTDKNIQPINNIYYQIPSDMPMHDDRGIYIKTV